MGFAYFVEGLFEGKWGYYLGKYGYKVGPGRGTNIALIINFFIVDITRRNWGRTIYAREQFGCVECVFFVNFKIRMFRAFTQVIYILNWIVVNAIDGTPWFTPTGQRRGFGINDYF